jgi:hypothetical protein
MFHELWSGDQSPTYCLQTSRGKTGNTIIACNRHRSPVIQNMIMLLSQTISITINYASLYILWFISAVMSLIFAAWNTGTFRYIHRRHIKDIFICNNVVSLSFQPILGIVIFHLYNFFNLQISQETQELIVIWLKFRFQLISV